MKLKLTNSEINAMIAALMMASIRYSSNDFIVNHPGEAKRYSDLENKLRQVCYDGDKIAKVELNTTFS